MNKLFSRPLRSGLLAAGLLSCVLAPLAAQAMPMPPVKAPSSDVTQVRDAPTTYQSPDIWIRRGPGNMHSNRANQGRNSPRWNRNDQWDHNRDWRRDSWRWRNDQRRWRDDSWRYRRHYGGGSGFYFGLGVIPSYNYYVAPRYAPRPRYYRSASSAHVRWCYDRYRSYRAWDNTYQPYYGPRRQCRSPYD